MPEQRSLFFSFHFKSSEAPFCAFPYVTAQETLVRLRATIRGPKHSGPFPRDLQIGHDLSLGAPMPERHRAWPLVKPLALRRTVTRSQTQNCFLPSLSHHAVQEHPLYSRRHRSNNVFVCRQPIVPRKRDAATTCTEDGECFPWTSHFPSAHEQHLIAT